MPTERTEVPSQSLEAIEKSSLSSEEAGLVSLLIEQGDKTAGEPSAVLGAVSVTVSGLESYLPCNKAYVLGEVCDAVFVLI